MVKVAKIINTHALKGECKLYLFTDDAPARFAKGMVFQDAHGKKYTVKSYREQKGLGYAFFEGVDSIEKAEPLKGKDLFVSEDDLPEPEEGEFYYHQLQGCTVLNEEGQNLGKITDILETGANLVLRVGQGKDSFLIPFVHAIVKDVNIPEKTIIIHEMEGLR